MVPIASADGAQALNQGFLAGAGLALSANSPRPRRHFSTVKALHAVELHRSHSDGQRAPGAGTWAELARQRFCGSPQWWHGAMS